MSQKEDHPQIVKLGPERTWEKLVKELLEIKDNNTKDAVRRKREIHREIREIARSDRRKWQEWRRSQERTGRDRGVDH